MPTTLVLDDEYLYRRISDHTGNFTNKEGSWRISSAAFGDRSLQPSVDRAIIRTDYPPLSMCVAETDGIGCLVAYKVRQYRRDANGNIITRIIAGEARECALDVKADPIFHQCRILDRCEMLENLAHALICGVPDFVNPDEKKLFKEKVTRSLARMATWVHLPASLRGDSTISLSLPDTSNADL